MNTELIQREFEAYRKAEHEARALLERAASENREPSAEEEAQFDALIAASDRHKARADKLVEQDAKSAAFAEAVRSRVGIIVPTTGDAPLGTDQRILAAIAQSKSDFARTSAYGVEVITEATVDLAKRARARISFDETRAIADFSDNGALYTTDFATNVAVYQRTASPWINLASVINANNGRPINLPNLTADPTSYSPGEGTAITESTPTIGSAALTTTAYKDLSYISSEAEEDELVGLLGLVSRAQGRSIGLKFGSDLTTTLLAAMTNGGTASGTGGNGTAANTFFGYEDLIDLKYGAAVPYRQAGAWVMSNGAIKKVRKFKDQNSEYFWNAAGGPGMPATFDGDPVYEDPYLATPASATKSVVYGDLSAVVIKQMPLRVATSIEFRFNLDQVAIRTVYRAGGALPDVAALRYLVSANT